MPGNEPNYELVIRAAKQFLIDVMEERRERDESERGNDAA